MSEYLLAFSISLIGLVFLLSNVVYSFVLRNKNKSLSFTLFSVYLVTMLVIETCCHALGFLKPGSNIFISHFYFNLQFIIVTLFFVFLFYKNKKVVLTISLLSLLVLSVIFGSYFLNYYNFWEFNLVEIALTSFTLFGYIVYYFYYTFKEKNVKFYYFFSGLGVYLLSSCLIFLTGNVELVIIDKPYLDIWVLNSIFYIMFQYFIFKELKYFKNT